MNIICDWYTCELWRWYFVRLCISGVWEHLCKKKVWNNLKCLKRCALQCIQTALKVWKWGFVKSKKVWNQIKIWTLASSVCRVCRDTLSSWISFLCYRWRYLLQVCSMRLIWLVNCYWKEIFFFFPIKIFLPCIKLLPTHSLHASSDL